MRTGAHLVALLGADPRYLKAVGLPGPQCIAGICGLSGPYAPRQLHEESGLLIRLWLKATRTTGQCRTFLLMLAVYVLAFLVWFVWLACEISAGLDG
eukprot:COSAG05_NODE_1657_length_4325_cov_122.451254_2_plen_97_part_00